MNRTGSSGAGLSLISGSSWSFSLHLYNMAWSQSYCVDDVCCSLALRCVLVSPAAVRVVLGSDELGGRRDEAEGETGRVLPGPRQFRPPIHPEPQLQVAGGHAPHPHGALQR